MAQSSMDQFVSKIKDNYLSIVLGVLVILIAFSILSKPDETKKGQNSKSTNILEKILNGDEDKEEIEVTNETQKTYTVKKGDHLWKIAEEKYGSGFNYVDIVSANKIKNPNVIEPGMKLIIPSVKAKTSTTGKVVEEASKITITGTSYKVQKGDHLWKIALNAYGDGYQWVKISKANKLANPGLIYPDQVLQIPR